VSTTSSSYYLIMATHAGSSALSPVNIGGLAATVIPWATNKRWPGEDDLRSFRVPLYVALAAPVLTLIAEVFLLVESPYWLMMKGRKEQARKALAFINPKSSEIDLDRAVAVLEYTLEKEAEANEQVIVGLFSRHREIQALTSYPCPIGSTETRPTWIASKEWICDELSAPSFRRSLKTLPVRTWSALMPLVSHPFQISRPRN
jgi:hypothetical protein